MRLKKIVETGLNWLGSRGDVRGAVLLYHRVDEPTLDPFNLCVSPSRFERQLALLAETGSALPLDEFMERKERGQLKQGSVCVTFDDGYLDVFEKALPLLEKYGIPATVFVTTGNLGEAFWWDRLASLIHSPETLPGSLFVEESQPPSYQIGGRSRKAVYDWLYPILRSASPERREAIFKTLAAQLDDPIRIEPQRAATAEEIRRAAEHPLLTIGAHTVTHSRLAALDDEAQIREMADSMSCLAAITGRTVDTLSYPFGLKGRDYDDRTLKAAASAGLRYAFSADRNAVTHRTPNLAIPRLWVHNRPESTVRRSLRLWTGSPAKREVSLPA